MELVGKFAQFALFFNYELHGNVDMLGIFVQCVDGVVLETMTKALYSILYTSY